MRAAVVGHVEWIDFLRVERIPAPGEIVHARDSWEQPGGGGAVAAVQLARLAGGCIFYTALGDDERGRRAAADLARLGVDVRARFRPESQRRATTLVDDAAERTILVAGERMDPRGEEDLGWDDLAGADCVYVTAGDAEALRLARRARVMVATARIGSRLEEVAVRLDALIGSARDPDEAIDPAAIQPPPRLIVQTDGERGGTYTPAGEAPVAYPAAPVPGPPVDAYGCGDSFAAALTWGLGAGLDPGEAIAVAAQCAASVLAARGPYAGQLGIEQIRHNPRDS